MSRRENPGTVKKSSLVRSPGELEVQRFLNGSPMRECGNLPQIQPKPKALCINGPIDVTLSVKMNWQ